jgi:ring-1,2-phenylacetyl-CoA epoxidase subunit PaaE
MAAFHPLTVTGVRPTIRDAVVVTLAPPEGADFSFTQGQYLTFRRSFDGHEIRRSYSICAGVDDGVLQVGIKRVGGGAFSEWANDGLKPGDVIEAMPPMGRFFVPLAPDQARHYLAFAGGSGITPVLSILRTTLAREPKARFTLVYANRAVNTIMFREELEDLKNQHMGRFSVIHVLETDAQEIDLFTGRVDGEKCAGLFESWIDIGSVDIALICGPEPMMLAIAEALRVHGLTKEQIKFELFASAQQGRLPERAAARATDAGDETAEVRITLDGATRTITMRRDQPLLEAVLENDIEAPHACRAAVCSTCRCRVLEGEVEMAANHALEDHEVADGYVLSCQAYPLSGRLVVDYDL